MLVAHIIFGVVSLVLHSLLLVGLSKNRGVVFATYGSISLTVLSGGLLFAHGANVAHVGVSLVLYAVAHVSLGYAREKVTI